MTSSARALLMRRDVLIGVAGGATAGVATLGVMAGWKRPALDTILPQLRIATADAPEVPPPLLNWPSLDALGQGMIDSKVTPGLSLSVMRSGNLFYSSGFGRATLAPSHAVTAHTGFRIASISKQFTAAAILLLMEEGKLALDDTLMRFLPDFPRAGEMTLRQLLSHTAGLDDYLSGRHADILTAAQKQDYSSDALLDILKACDPLFRCAPGTKWVYSNTGFALLGLVVEKLSGLSLAAFCQERLFTPAGMERTAIDPAVASDPDLCEGHRANRGLRDGFGQVWPVSPSFAGGSGALRSTSADLCRWHAALMSGLILKPASLAAMLTPTRLSNDSFALDRENSMAPGYGLGMRLGFIDGQPVFTHSGRINGFTGQLLTLPALQLTIAMLYNCDGANSGSFYPAVHALRQEALRLGRTA